MEKFEKYHIYYAVKANSNTHIISTLKKAFNEYENRNRTYGKV